MRSLRSSLAAALVALAVAALAGSARADEPETPDIAEARASFVKGTELAKRAQWAEALAAFERSSSLRPHAVTTYNLGICHRAMGNYTLARETFAKALADGEASGQMPAPLVAEDRTYITEIDGLLATAKVELAPANAAIAIDGRPLAARPDGALVAGVRPPGAGEAPPSGSFRLSLNPGAHVITVSRAGFADAVVNRTFAPGSTSDLRLELDKLPATIHVASSQSGAVVTVDGIDVGVAPVDVSRPAGSYHVVVRKAGFKTFDQRVDVQSGQAVDLRAPLPKEETALTQRWWFWTAAGVLVAGVAAGTYALTRGETTQREPLDGGTLGWAVKLK